MDPGKTYDDVGTTYIYCGRVYDIATYPNILAIMARVVTDDPAPPNKVQ
jgi:hypothetical protein